MKESVPMLMVMNSLLAYTQNIERLRDLIVNVPILHTIIVSSVTTNLKQHSPYEEASLYSWSPL